MFTGIVEEVGRLDAVEITSRGRRLTVSALQVLSGLRPGDSVALDGVCQTAVHVSDASFTVEAIPTTLERTTLGSWEVGRRINLERALALGDRLGGHLVQGHVDAVGEVVNRTDHPEHTLLEVRMPTDVAEVTTLHGSITINGVSLTVNGLLEGDVAQVALIPFTLQHTNLAELRAGARVNLEGDMLGRFVVHYLQRRRGSG